MSPNEILTVIKEAIDTFRNIAAKPTDNDMSRMNGTLLPILFNIPYDQVKTTHNLSGLISSSAKYIAKYGTAFQRPRSPIQYSPTITTTMSDAERRKAETTHSASKEDYLLYEAAEMGVMHFLSTNVDKMWYQ